MEKIISREYIISIADDYRLVLETETHHEHVIIEDVHGTYRWKSNPTVEKYLEKCGGLNDVLSLFYNLGYDKNSEIFRQLYRDIGISINGYWEVFYWSMNNDDTEKYIENRKLINRRLKINRLLK